MRGLLVLSAILALWPGGRAVGAADRAGAFDLQQFMDSEIKAGKKRVVVPPGRYRVTPQKRQHLAFKNLRDIEIIAEGVEMICTETTRALTFERCENFRLKGLTIDYDPLPFTQGRIVALATDKSWLEFELLAGYPAHQLEIRIEIFDPATGLLRRDTYYGWQPITKVGERRYRVAKGAGYRMNLAHDTEQVGDILVTNHAFAPGGSIPHAVYSDRCVNLELEDIVLFASNCFGFLETGCDGTIYRRCRIDRRSAASELAPRGHQRMRSLNADAFHSKHALKGPAILECQARFQGDDCVNINGDYHMVMAVQGRALRVLAKHDLNIQPDDPVELVEYGGKRLPDARVVAVVPDGTIEDGERAFLSRQRMNEDLKNARGALNKAFKITLDREVNLPRGSLIAAANRMGNGFAVKGCDFGWNRSRGILIKASRGEVSGNRLQGSWMSAILVSPEYWWLEAGSSGDVRIRDNTISACGGIPICIEAVGGNGEIAPAGAHKNIAITGNVIRDCAPPGILVTSTRGLQLDNNTLELSRPAKGIPGLMRKAKQTELRPVVQINCELAPP